MLQSKVSEGSDSEHVEDGAMDFPEDRMALGGCPLWWQVVNFYCRVLPPCFGSFADNNRIVLRDVFLHSLKACPSQQMLKEKTLCSNLVVVAIQSGHYLTSSGNQIQRESCGPVPT